jgi:predicted DNA-binding transcriptional regulator AlpA
MPRDTTIMSPAELIGPAEAAKLLGIGRTSLHSLRLTERFAPATVELCGPKWRRQEVLDWIAAGCPHRKAWAWKGGRR